MVRIRIQLPKHLYEEAKRVAEDYEMSFAEIVRRSLERTLAAYPPRNAGDWKSPAPVDLGLKTKVDNDEWRLIANDPSYQPRALRRKRRLGQIATADT